MPGPARCWAGLGFGPDRCLAIPRRSASWCNQRPFYLWFRPTECSSRAPAYVRALLGFVVAIHEKREHSKRARFGCNPDKFRTAAHRPEPPEQSHLNPCGRLDGPGGRGVGYQGPPHFWVRACKFPQVGRPRRTPQINPSFTPNCVVRGLCCLPIIVYRRVFRVR